MTDLKITRLCAEAMGWKHGLAVPEVDIYWVHPRGPKDRRGEFSFDPLHDDAQAMALVKKFDAWIQPPMRDGIGALMEGWKVDISVQDDREEVEAISPDLNRAICECVAKLKQGER